MSKGIYTIVYIHRNHPKVGMKVIIVAYPPKKGAKIHCSCIKNSTQLHATGSCIPVANMVVAYDRISSSDVILFHDNEH